MKKLLILMTIVLIAAAPIFSEDSADTDTEPGFGLQSNIFRYVLTTSNAMLNTATGSPTNFEELNDYPLTPGDIFTLLINYGANSERSADYITNYSIQLLPDYTMVLPFIGKTDVKGMNINKLQTYISNQISEMMPVQFVSFNLTRPASFNVFIYGGVNVSGYINATPVTTVIDAIALCKGFKSNASYRDVRIIRGEESISVDISNFYKNADFESNPRLLPGDKLFVPMAERVVTVNGMVKYPGIYELTAEENLDTLLNLAGDLKPGASKERIEVARVDGAGKTERLQTAYSAADSFVLTDGDIISVPSISENADTITIEGAVYGKVMPGTAPFVAPTTSVKLEVPYYPGISLLNVLDKVGGPTPYAITERAEIRRPEQGEFIALDIENLWDTRKSSYDVKLEPGDHILIPVERTVVAVFGAVNSGDTTASAIPHMNGYTVMDYIIAAGGIDYKTASPNNISIIDGEGNRTRVELTDEVPPGSLIYVDKNLLHNADEVFSNIFTVTVWATTIMTFITTVIQFAGSF